MAAQPQPRGGQKRPPPPPLLVNHRSKRFGGWRLRWRRRCRRKKSNEHVPLTCLGRRLGSATGSVPRVAAAAAAAAPQPVVCVRSGARVVGVVGVTGSAASSPLAIYRASDFGGILSGSTDRVRGRHSIGHRRHSIGCVSHSNGRRRQSIGLGSHSYGIHVSEIRVILSHA